MKKILFCITMLYSMSASANDLTVRLQNMEYYEIKRSNQPYVLIHDAACNIRSTFQRIISLIPAEELSDSLHSMYQRINLGYLTIQLHTAKDAVKSAYASVVNHLSSLLETEESDQLKNSLEQYYRSIDNGEYAIVMEEAPQPNEQI